MPKIPKKPSDIFQEITDNYKNIFEDDLISIILYGSGAKGEYQYKISDINFIIILTENGIDNLQKCLPLIPKWQRRNVSTPLFLTEKYINSSLDTFPIEFLNMNMNYQLVYGEDLLAAIEIEEEDLRLQCERELRGKLLHLREEFLNSARYPRQLKTLISQSISAFTSIFTILLKLANVDLPTKREDIFKKTAEIFNLNYSIFEVLLQIRDKKKKISKQQLHTLIEQYIREIKKLTQAVDKL